MSISIGKMMFFDIETVGTDEDRVLDLVFPHPEKPNIEDAPVNYGAEAKENWVDRRLETLQEKREKNLRQAALDIDSAKIVSIAWAVGESDIVCATGEEQDILHEFCEEWNSHTARSENRSCGYNSINYDWSVILRRLAMLDLGHYILTPPNMNRYSGEMDLANVAYNFGYAAGKRKGLKTLAQLLNIEVPVKDVSGEDVATLDEEELIEYNKSDVHITREVFKKLNGVYF